MRPKKHTTYTPAALDADGLMNDVAYSGGGYAITANDAGDSLAHLITILGNAATNHSGKTFTVTGTDADGKAQTETLAGPNGVATITTTKHFKTVTSITVDSTTGADTFDAGWTGVSVGPTYPVDWRSSSACNIAVDVTGTINFSVQETIGDIYRTSTPAQDCPWFSISALASKTADTNAPATVGVGGIRVLVNSLTATATFTMYTSQSPNQ